MTRPQDKSMTASGPRFGRWRKAAADDRGTSLVEFAVFAPFLILMVLGISDLGVAFSQRYFLQQAVNRTLEMAHLGKGDSSYDYLIPEAAAAAGVPQNKVTLQKWLECNGTSKNYTDTCAAGEQMARYMRLTINSSFRPSFSSVAFPNVLADGSVPIAADASLRVQ